MCKGWTTTKYKPFPSTLKMGKQIERIQIPIRRIKMILWRKCKNQIQPRLLNLQLSIDNPTKNRIYRNGEKDLFHCVFGLSSCCSNRACLDSQRFIPSKSFLWLDIMLTNRFFFQLSHLLPSCGFKFTTKMFFFFWYTHYVYRTIDIRVCQQNLIKWDKIQ